MSSDATLKQQQFTIMLVVLAYQVVSISLVFLNKVLMDKRTSIEAPLFITWFQCVVTVFICWLCGELGARAKPGSFFKQFPRFQYKLPVAKSLLPLSIVFVGMITFNNLCLKYVEVSFYNVARSLTIVFNVIFTYFMLGETTSFNTLLCLGTVVAGFFAGSKGEVNFSLIGTLFGVASSVFVSLNAIYCKKVMPLVDGNQWALSAYNNMNAVLLFLPIILISDELSVLAASGKQLASTYFWSIMVVGGIAGFLIGIVTILQIKFTSPLTHNISGTAKACIQTLLALVIYQNATNFTNLLGVALVLAGSMAYSAVRTKEMQDAARAKPATKAADGAAAPALAPVKTSEATSEQQEEEAEEEDDTSEMAPLRHNGATARGGRP